MENSVKPFADTGVLCIDIQEKLLPHVADASALEERTGRALEAFRFFSVPVFVTQQYTPGLGQTVPSLMKRVSSSVRPYEKTAFSCYREASIRSLLEDSSLKNWVLMGLEAHICVLLTAFDLLKIGKNVIVAEDLVGSRHRENKETALYEMRFRGVRVTSFETLIFEWLEDARNPLFRRIKHLFL